MMHNIQFLTSPSLAVANLDRKYLRINRWKLTGNRKPLMALADAAKTSNFQGEKGWQVEGDEG